MAEPKAPKPALAATHAGSVAGAIVSTGFLMLAWLRPDIPTPPPGLEGYVVVVASFIGGIVGRVLRKRGLI